MAFRFDPDAMAWYEAEGWRAYYDKNIPRGVWLMARLIRSQFGLSWRETAPATLDVVRAYLAFQPKDGDWVETRRHLESFYRRALGPSGMAYDPRLVAQRELEYWIVHRVTAGDEKREPLILSLAELHAALFGRPIGEMRRSAEHRERAAQAVDRITSGRTTSAQQDWAVVHSALRDCYRDIRQRLQAVPA
ncbi:MAG: hypothetical protein U0556_16965 [Dehalococcoidia bacterium]